MRPLPLRPPSDPPTAPIPAVRDDPARAATVPLPAVGGRTRVEWVDAAKGLTITLVVLHHVTLFLQPHGLVPAPIVAANMALTALRMPLFFLVSGLFFAGPMAGSWRSLLHKRVAFFGYLYLLWVTLQFLATSLLPPDVAVPDVTQDAGEFARALLVPATAMWFLYALVLYSVLAKLARPVPPWVQLVVSGALSAVLGAELLGLPGETWTVTGRYLFFFLLGCHARAVVERLAALTGLRRLAVGAPAVLVAAVTAVAVSSGLRPVPGLALALNVSVVVCGVLLFAWIGPWPVTWPLRVLGRNTLPIYLSNVPLVAWSALVLRHVPVPLALRYPLPVLLAAVVTVVALAARRALRALGLRWLYELPRSPAHRPATAQAR